MPTETQAKLREVLDAIDRLLALFRFERMVHMVIGVVSFLMLLYGVVLLFGKTEVTAPLLATLFGTSGLITASSVRITYFFNKAFALVEEVIRKGMQA